MAVRGENSSYFGENGRNLKPPNFSSIYESLRPKFEPIDFSNFDIVTAEELNQKQITKQQEILNWIKKVSINQSSASKKQFIVIVWLTTITILLGLVTAYLTYLSLSDSSNDAHTVEQENILLKENLEQKQSILELRNEVEELRKITEKFSAEIVTKK